MTRFKTLGAAIFFGAAAALASALASPAMAQAVISDPGYCAQFYPNANCQNEGPGNPYTGDYQQQELQQQQQAYGRNGPWQNSYNSWGDRRSRVSPGHVASGTAYARQNGSACTPGTWFRSADGRRHVCQ